MTFGWDKHPNLYNPVFHTRRTSKSVFKLFKEEDKETKKYQERKREKYFDLEIKQLHGYVK